MLQFKISQSDQMHKKIIFILIMAALTIVCDGVGTKRVIAKCAASSEGIYNSISSKIENSDIAQLNNLSCTETTEINKYAPDAMHITSGRKRGKYTICLSNDSLNPCKYIIGTFIQNKNPSDMLLQVFDLPKPKRTKLNETVERLFFKPSLLID